ncbi:MAG TPA: metalloregulator ArsR/SmtB family transcription factor [Roseiflexaceae bacterium]|nr:metalloregulator ArsR/SmtB family transcription factor [Roseiflexaceae bacterium]
MPTRAAKEALFTVVAQIAQAAANPHRLELLDLLVQAPRTVEQLAAASALSLANASQHLQRLKRAGLVDSIRQGTSVRYQLADPSVARLWVELRTVAARQLPQLERALDTYRPNRARFATVDAETVAAGVQDGSIVLLDVRPRLEYEAGHLPGARSIPLEELPQRLEELPREALIVTYCRGPLCVYADQALEQILASGRRGARLEAGVAEWQLGGLPLQSTAGSLPERPAP